MPYILNTNSAAERFPVTRVGLDYPITLILPYSVLADSEAARISFMREFLQADIDDRVIPPKVEVVCVIKPPDGGEIVSPATMEQIGYLAACAATDLGDNHPGIAELRTYVAEQAL